jgi:murein L,D-transpeptidase YafK
MHRVASPLLFAVALGGCASVPSPPRPAPPSPEAATFPLPPLPRRPAAAPAGVDLVVVDKSARTLTLYAAGRALKTYHGIQLGNPLGPKRFQGDRRTPEGRYVLDYRNPQSSYHLSLHISYPNAEDAAYARSRGRSPGGDVFVHGQPNWLDADRAPGDWTDGCIALSDAEMDELWETVPDGTPIEIDP